MKIVNIEKDNLKMGTIDIFRYYYEGLHTPKDVYQFFKYLQARGFTIEGDICVEFDTDHAYMVPPISFASPEEFFESSNSIDWEDVKYLDIAGKYNEIYYSGSVCPGKDSGLFVLSIPKGSVVSLYSTHSGAC